MTNFLFQFSNVYVYRNFKLHSMNNTQDHYYYYYYYYILLFFGADDFFGRWVALAIWAWGKRGRDVLCARILEILSLTGEILLIRGSCSCWLSCLLSAMSSVWGGFVRNKNLTLLSSMHSHLKYQSEMPKGGFRKKKFPCLSLLLTSAGCPVWSLVQLSPGPLPPWQSRARAGVWADPALYTGPVLCSQQGLTAVEWTPA